MTVIAPAGMAATPLLSAGGIGDLSTTANFGAVFAVEVAVLGPAPSVPVQEVEAAGTRVTPLIAAGTKGVADTIQGLEDAAGPELETIGDVAGADGQTAEIRSPVIGVDLPSPVISVVAQSAAALAVSKSELDKECDPLIQSRFVMRPTPMMAKSSIVAKTTTEQRLAQSTVTEPTSETPVVSDVPRATLEQPARVPDQLAPAIDGTRPTLVAVLPNNTPVERLLASLSHESPAERQWLDTVIRDVASVAVKSGDVRFRVEPEGFGRMTIERTADRLEISVTEPRAVVVAEAARPQVLARAATLGVPVAGATVVLDQSGQRGREDTRQRQPIEQGKADEAGEDRSADIGRYA